VNVNGSLSAQTDAHGARLSDKKGSYLAATIDTHMRLPRLLRSCCAGADVQTHHNIAQAGPAWLPTHYHGLHEVFVMNRRAPVFMISNTQRSCTT